MKKQHKEIQPVEVQDDLDRILSLPRRQPLNCSVDPITKKYDPRAQALVEVMTSRLGRGSRVSCACRPRVVRSLGGGQISILRVLPEDVPPEPPRVVSLDSFVRDHQANADEIAAAQQVSRLRAGEEVRLPSMDGDEGHFCYSSLNPIQAWSLYEIPKESGGLGFIGVGGGKCTCQDTEIFDVFAGRRRLVEEPGQLAVPSFDGKNVVEKPAVAFPSGRKPCCELALADGSKIRLSLDHSILTHRGWVHAGDLKVDSDFVAVPTSLPEPQNPTPTTDEEVSMLAFLMADGGCTGPALTFTDDNTSVIEEFLRLAPLFFNGVTESPKRKGRVRQFGILGSGVRGTGFREKWDLFHYSKERRLHPSAWGFSNRHVTLFLNRFWACDGHVGERELECTLASEKLVDDIRFLLLRLGIRSRKKYKLARCEGKEFDAWRILISGADALRFLRVVGDVLGSEDRCRRLREKLESTVRNPNVDVVPVGRQELSEICDELGFPRFAGGRRKKGQASRPRRRTELTRDYFQATDGQFVSREKFIGFCRQYDYHGKFSHLGVEDLAWERVASVTSIGEQDVYDLSVPETENFVADGMVIHNSGLFILLPTALGSECELAVLLIEPNQREHYVSQYKRVREHFRVPTLVTELRPYIATSAQTTLHLLPYSKLSNPKYPEELDNLNGNVILADEAHRLTGKANTTGRIRLRQYITKKIKEREARLAAGLPVKRRAVYLIPMSGTLEDKSVEDTQPVAAHALGTGSPLPLDEAEASRWSAVFDPVRSPDRTSTTALRLQMAFAGRTWGPNGGAIEAALDCDKGPEQEIRLGFQKRRAETPGVITATIGDTVTSISFRERRAPKMPEVVKAALEKVRAEGVRPDGEVIVGDSDNNVEAMVKIVSKQIACGFYYIWAFPRIPCTCNGQEPRCEGCKLIDEWYARRKRYGKELRLRLLQPLPHLDSPKLCKNAAIRAAEDGSAPPYEVYCADCREMWPCGKSTHLPAWRSEHWRLWGEIENKVPHEQRVKWIGDKTPEAADPETHPGYFLVRDMVKYALGDPGILWVQSTALGQKAAQLSKLHYHGGGPGAEALIRAETGKKSIIASLKAWGKGLDGLQHKVWRQLFCEFPSSGKVIEQALGRLARRGQKKDTVETEYYAHVTEYREAIRKSKRYAAFNEAMTGMPSLILSADWDKE